MKTTGHRIPTGSSFPKRDTPPDLAFLPGLFLVRIFIGFPGCWPSPSFKLHITNDMGRFLASMRTLKPYHYWRWADATHHSASGNMDERKKWVNLVLQDRQYNKKTPYRLVLRDGETGIEQQSVEVVIDRAFTDDF